MLPQQIEQKVKYFKIASDAFKQGKNIVDTLVNYGATKSESIELAYELQAGEYTACFNDLGLRRNKEIHAIINKYANLPDVESIGVFGIGEAKNWIGYRGNIKHLVGVDLSYSRLRFAYQNLQNITGINSFKLVKGDASETIFKHNSFDISITLHSIEPNGNKQGAIMLNNVINCASQYILLFEPDYSTAHSKMRDRMIKHDYSQNLSDELQKLDSIHIIDKFIMNTQETTDNLTTCWLIEKKLKEKSEKQKFICPYSRCELADYSDYMYSPESGLAYSIIDDFVFLNTNDAIFLGSK